VKILKIILKLGFVILLILNMWVTLHNNNLIEYMETHMLYHKAAISEIVVKINGLESKQEKFEKVLPFHTVTHLDQ
jgi:hypothetical protein